MSECICFINQKGGVGKTTVCNAIAFSLIDQGYKVLIIDLDPQGNLTFSLDSENSNLSQILLKQLDIQDSIINKTDFDLIPSDASLASLDIFMTDVGKEFRLKEALKSIYHNYDFILIDTPPGLGILTINALTAADSLVIPAQPDIFSLQGIGQLYQTIESVKTYCNPDLIIKGIVINRFNSRTIISRDMEALLKNTADQMHTKVFDTKIRECTALKEAAALKTNIFDYNNKSNASFDFQALTKEVVSE